MANLLFASRESDSLRSEIPGRSQPSRGLVLVGVSSRTWATRIVWPFSYQRALKAQQLESLQRSGARLLPLQEPDGDPRHGGHDDSADEKGQHVAHDGLHALVGVDAADRTGRVVTHPEGRRE